MSFCTKCGTELKEDDRFCPKCGAQARQKDAAEEKAFPGKAVVLTLLLIAVIIIGVFIWKLLLSGGGQDRTKYANYVNDNVYFSLDYPEGYLVTEPEDNNVLITDGEEADFQVSVEYAYHTTTDCAIYSAADFAGQVQQDEKVLTGWLGAEDVRVTDSKQSKIGGRDCFEYDFELEMKGARHTGKLYILDSSGDFGCYSYMQVINQDAKKADLYKKQCDAMADSFKITGNAQAEGYTLYEFDDAKLLLRDEAVYRAEGSEKDIDVYPVKGAYSEASVCIRETVYEEEKDITEVFDGCCGYYFSYKDRAKYLSGMTEAAYGRYPYTCVELEFYDSAGKHYRVLETLFVHDGKYWRITMESTDEYHDVTSSVFSDVLFSFIFTDDESADEDVSLGEISGEKDRIGEIIAEIEGQQGYAGKVTWDPLAVFGDFNEDGVEEFLAVYELKRNDTVEVMYELWSLPEKGAEKIRSEVLFQEAGGNYGVVGIVKKEDSFFLAVETKNPAGENFNNYHSYIPWSRTESSLGEEDIYLESHGTYGEEEKGRYILGDSVVDKSRFDARKAEFSNWIYKIDLSEGAGNGGAKTLEEYKNGDTKS